MKLSSCGLIDPGQQLQPLLDQLALVHRQVPANPICVNRSRIVDFSTGWLPVVALLILMAVRVFFFNSPRQKYGAGGGGSRTPTACLCGGPPPGSLSMVVRCRKLSQIMGGTHKRRAGAHKEDSERQRWCSGAWPRPSSKLRKRRGAQTGMRGKQVPPGLA